VRICSLLPSATEIVCSLGLEASLAGVSHECDYPPSVRSKPVLTRSRIDQSGKSSAEIDALVSQKLHEHDGIYALDEQLLAQLRPDLILTQELCEVCAVSYEQVCEAVRALRGDQIVLSLEPNDLAGILATIAAVGEATRRQTDATALITVLESDLEELRATGSQRARRPRVACLEWLDPPFSAGHWVPEMVAIAGGIDVLATPRDRSKRLTWDDVASAEPDVLVLMPCGFDVNGTAAACRSVLEAGAMKATPASITGEVYAVDANAYFSRPGPRIVRGVEILVEILSAPGTGQAFGEGWVRIDAAASRSGA
jgi:iron complex transport system substrate-binding protein